MADRFQTYVYTLISKWSQGKHYQKTFP